ncbi:MAG TPA: restriction endonuclease subunit S [Rhizomicrobium sp.]|jgi:type I restriction enzyme S subunit
MIEGLKPYPAYKESGVPWLGQVPEHWSTSRLRNVAELLVSNVDKKTEDGEQLVRLCNYVDAYKRAIITAELPFMQATATHAEVKRFRLHVNDVLITKDSEDWKDIGVPAYVAETADDLICGYHLAILRPRAAMLGRFLYWQLLSEASKVQFSVRANGITRYGLSHGAIKEICFAVPSTDEQASIARFVGHAERKIGRYIAAKRKLIKLLEEEKQAIVHRAVTRGLDQDVRLKRSGIDWLGDIPEHWEVKPAKVYLREIDERSTTGDEELLSVSHKTGVTPRSQKNITMFMAESYRGHKMCKRDDVVVNTMWGWMAAIGVAGQVGIVSPSYGVYRPARTEQFRSRFLDLLLRIEMYRDEYVRCSRGITTSRLRLYPDQFLKIALLRPPLTEQDSILRKIEDDTASLSATISAASREIDLFNEFRTCMISNVVTGKLDVREAAAALPVEIDQELEPEPEEELLEEDTESELEPEQEAA